MGNVGVPESTKFLDQVDALARQTVQLEEEEEEQKEESNLRSYNEVHPELFQEESIFEERLNSTMDVWKRSNAPLSYSKMMRCVKKCAPKEKKVQNSCHSACKKASVYGPVQKVQGEQ